MRQVLASRVAVQYLQKEDLDGSNRIELRIVPVHARFSTGLSDSSLRNFFRPILLEMSNHFRDTESLP